MWFAPGQKCSNFFWGFGCGRKSMGFACDLGLRFEGPQFKFSCESFTFHNSMSSSSSSKSARCVCEKKPEPSGTARMVFALSCTSAACERVFSLVDAMFGEDQRSSLADQVQAGVMLRYNKRQVHVG